MSMIIPNVEELIDKDHFYRKLLKVVDWTELTKPLRNLYSAQGCHAGVIMKNNMKAKDKDRDRWLSSVRMPFEGVFSPLSKRASYRGLLKNQFQNLMQALAFNLKRL